MSLICFSNIDGNYQTLLTQLIDVNKLFRGTREGDGYRRLTYIGPPHTTIVVVGNWLPDKSCTDVSWTDLTLICKLFLKMKEHIVLICGKREYDFTMDTWQHPKKPSYYKDPTPMDFFESYWIPVMQMTQFYYIYNQEYLISYAPFTSLRLKKLLSYKKSIPQIWRAGLKLRDIITMQVFRRLFESNSLLTRPRDWRRKHLQDVTALLDVPERIRYIVAVPVPYFYSTFFPKGSSIEGVRLHEDASEFMTTVTSELDDVWYREIDPYRVHPKGKVETIAKIEPDVYCMTMANGPSRIQSLFIQEDEYPRIIS